MDKPKSLGDPIEIQQRLELIHDDHIGPLTNFVHNVRTSKGLDYFIPYFDPLDGGIESTILFLLEAPGSNAVKSGFVSRNNPDETAKNMFKILEELELPRNKTVLWNTIPWYIGDGKKIRPANAKDILQSWPYILALIDLLPKIETVVLVGRKAQRIKVLLQEQFHTIEILECYHPSPLFVNTHPKNRERIIEQLRGLKKPQRKGTRIESN